MRNAIFVFLILLIELNIGVTSITGTESKRSWPLINPVKKTFHFIDHREMGAKLRIVSIDGTPLYLLECYLNAYDRDDPDFNYSGNFECRLTSLYSKERYSTLLTDQAKPTRDWQSRGRFLLEELTGKCAEYPDYGRVRHFRLRGMNLTLEIKNLKIKSGSSAENVPWYVDRIEKLDLDVIITPDPKASSEIAEPTKYPPCPN
jgi:hypothetical protein